MLAAFDIWLVVDHKIPEQAERPLLPSPDLHTQSTSSSIKTYTQVFQVRFMVTWISDSKVHWCLQCLHPYNADNLI